jgi:hypothetical protein
VLTYSSVNLSLKASCNPVILSGLTSIILNLPFSTFNSLSSTEEINKMLSNLFFNSVEKFSFDNPGVFPA